MAQRVEVNNPLRYLALGDSYTIGQGVSVEDRWPNQLVKALKSRGIKIKELRIIAQTGWRTDNLLNAINSETPDSNYNLVSLLIGVNNQYQERNIDVYSVEFRKLLGKAITLCGGRKEGVFVLSIPDYGYTPFGSTNQAAISAEIDQYNQIKRKIAREMGVAYFDITPISREAINKPEYVASDNLHPSGTMYAQWIELLLSGSAFKVYTSTVLQMEETNKIVVYPNPASSSIKIRTPQNGNTIGIYNSVGFMVWQSDKLAAEELNIDVSGWPNGMYYYQIKQNNKSFLSGKFLVE